jgi:hypothetical protein
MNPAQHHTHAAQRREQVAALYLQGYSQHKIATQVGVSQQQVSQDIKAMQKAWLASALRDFEAAKAQELAKIDAAECAYWMAWERSFAPREVTTTKQIDGKDPREETTIRREQPVGDPRFLDGVVRCIQQRCDLLGLSTATAAAKAVSTGLAALIAQAKSTIPPAAPMAEA